MSARSSYTKVARANSEAQTREALLDSAEETFFAADWTQASLVSIAESAGVTKQTLLRHFGSKDGLLRAAYARAFERVKDQRLASPKNDVAGAVRNLIDHYEELGERALKLGTVDDAALGLEMSASARQFHYDWIDHAFGSWLIVIAPAERARIRGALIVLCDVHAWAILRRDLALTRPETEATLEAAINRLLENEQ